MPNYAGYYVKRSREIIQNFKHRLILESKNEDSIQANFELAHQIYGIELSSLKEHLQDTYPIVLPTRTKNRSTFTYVKDLNGRLVPVPSRFLWDPESTWIEI